jgi:hypothetical protein
VNTVGRKPEDLEPGEGAIVEADGKKVAASRYESDGAVKNGPTRHPLDPVETAT